MDKTTVPKLTAVHSLSTQELLDSFDDGFTSMTLTDGLTVYSGKMFNEPTTAIVTATGEFYYLTHEGNENE